MKLKITFNYVEIVWRMGVGSMTRGHWADFGSGLIGVLSLGAVACGGDSAESEPPVQPPETYAFDSRFQEGTSVSYSGQTMRHVLIKQIDTFIEGLTASIDGGTLELVAGDVRQELDAYYGFKSDQRGKDPFSLGIDAMLVQSTFDDIATDKDLQGKFAGSGGEVEHSDWKSKFRGAAIAGSEAFLLKLFDELDALAAARAKGEFAISQAEPVYVTADGVDLRQMINKLLLMGVTYAQATDKYLDERVDDADNAQLVEDGAAEPYSELEHAWDEAFGYFGAARDYGKRDDETNAKEQAHDSDGDGKIDLTSEMTFGAAVNAAKRDGASVSATDFSGDAWRAFLTGRAIIASAGDVLTEAQKTALVAQRDAARDAWENAIAATVVHYINETLVDLGALDGGGFELASLAQHFAEMKAFALGLQFSPTSRLAGSAFEAFHAAIGESPVLPAAGRPAVDAYTAKLLEARKIMQDAYGFAPENMGDDAGAGGW